MNATKFFSALLNNFFRTKTTTLAASLAFYTSLSLAPLLILFVMISGQSDSHWQQIFLTRISDVVGADAALTFKMILENAKTFPDLSSASGIVGILILILSAGLIFGQLRDALNEIFDEHSVLLESHVWWMNIWLFAQSLVVQVVLALGFVILMIVSLAVSTAISVTSTYLNNALLISLLNISVSGVIYVGLYTLMFRFIPRHHLAWRQSLEGGAITALMFLIGKELIGAFLGSFAVGSSYGAAGSIVVLLAWVFYSALITLIGAHISFLLHKNQRRLI